MSALRCGDRIGPVTFSMQHSGGMPEMLYWQANLYVIGQIQSLQRDRDIARGDVAVDFCVLNSTPRERALMSTLFPKLEYVAALRPASRRGGLLCSR